MVAVRLPCITASLRCLLLAGVLCGLLAASAQAQERRPRSQREAVRALESVARHHLSALDNAALRARYPQSGPGPLRFAEPRPATLRADRDGTWEVLDDGTALWRLRVQSEGAQSLNLGFTEYHLPPDAELFLYTPDHETVVGPFTAADNAAHGELWTPILPGDEAIVEVTVPAAHKAALRLTLGQVNHGFRPIRASAQKASGACNVDVACQEADDWRDEVRSVATYSINGSRICSGVLVNNTAGDRTPYFLTAAHCGVTPENAASMVVYWNYENSTCRPPGSADGEGDGPLNQFTSGAIHRASYSGSSPGIPGGPDFTLVELDEPVDPAYDVHFAGWDWRDALPDSSVTIHHPQGEEKRISFDFDPATITSWLEFDVTDGPTHFRVGNWEVGTTEPGSSGAPLFDLNRRVVGLLSGGYAACGNDGSDWYGRLALAWDGGGTPETRLRDWLDPLDVGAVATLGLDDNESDTTPPAAIQDLEVTNAGDDRVVLSWTPPGDDGFEGGAAAFYDLRYSTSPLRNEADFEAATPVSAVPLPASPGDTQSASIESLAPDAYYHFGIVAYDNAGNRSPIGTTADETVLLRANYLIDAFPNPFQHQATVRFSVKESQRLEAELFDALGRRVRTLYRGVADPNNAVYVPLDAHNLASGRYFVRLTGESFSTVKPITLVR